MTNMDFLLKKEIEKFKGEISSKDYAIESEKYSFERQLKNGLGEELISALRKISLEDDEDYCHGSVEERENKISKK